MDQQINVIGVQAEPSSILCQKDYALQILYFCLKTELENSKYTLFQNTFPEDKRFKSIALNLIIITF